MADANFLIQTILTRHTVVAAGMVICTLDSPFLDLVIIYHTNVILSTVFVRFDKYFYGLQLFFDFPYHLLHFDVQSAAQSVKRFERGLALPALDGA